MNTDHGFQSWTPASVLESSRLDARFYNPQHTALLSALYDNASRVDTLGRLVSHLAHVTGYESTKYMDFVDDIHGVKVVEAMNVGDTLVEGREWKRIRRDGYDCMPRHQLRDGDLVFSKDGTLGNCALVTPFVLPAVASRHVFRIAPKPDLVDSGYLTVWLSSSAGRTQTTYRQAGAVQGTIITPEISSFRVLLPSVEIQRAIGNKIRKAERLRELNLQAHFEFAAWLTAASKEADLTPSVAGCLKHVPANTCPDWTWVAGFNPADRVDPWPHHLAPRSIRSHLCTIDARGFADCFDVATSQRERRNPPIAPGCFSISVLDVGADGVVDWDKAATTRYESPGTLIEPGDILYSTLNPHEPRVAVVPRDVGRQSVCSPEFSILRIRPDATHAPYLFAALLRSLWIRVQASFLTRSSSLSRRRLDEADLPRILLPWQDEGIETLDDHLKQAIDGSRESKSLVTSAKRDVEHLIAGTLDESALLLADRRIARWLDANPLPESNTPGLT